MSTERVLGMFELTQEIARFRPEDNAAGRRAETLVKTDGLRVVLVTMRAGATLHEHTAPGPITVHALQGSFRVTVEADAHELAAGGLISIATGIRHAVHALEDGAFLLTIGATSSP